MGLPRPFFIEPMSYRIVSRPERHLSRFIFDIAPPENQAFIEKIIATNLDRAKFVGLTRLQLDEIGRERQVQRQGAQRAEARAELSVELAQARILPAYELGR